MKNLRASDLHCFNFFSETVDQKEEEEIRNQLHAMDEVVENAYIKYQSLFDSNELHQLSQLHLQFSQQKLLISLYLYSSKSLKNLRENIENRQPKAIRYICQLCSLEYHDSFDHFVPQGEFPEFAIIPLNLIPCCSHCNRKKSSNWRHNGTRTSLNLYIDILPQIQYLFVKIIDDGLDIDFEYELRNEGIDDNFFELIQRHFTALGLPNRLRRASISLISELQQKIVTQIRTRPLHSILADIRQDAIDLRSIYGFNYWRSVLHLALVESPTFLALFK